MSNPRYTKVREIRQYSEIVYYRDGQEIGRDTLQDDLLYEREPVELMTVDAPPAYVLLATLEAVAN